MKTDIGYHLHGGNGYSQSQSQNYFIVPYTFLHIYQLEIQSSVTNINIKVYRNLS